MKSGFFLTGHTSSVSQENRAKACFGFFARKPDAMKAIAENCTDMFECYYSYLVLEEIPEGLRRSVKNETWFLWDRKQKKWAQVEKPKKFEGTTNFSIG